jgi:hypothetical protein
MQMPRYRDREYHERERTKERDMHQYMNRQDQNRSGNYMPDEYQRPRLMKSYSQRPPENISLAAPSSYDTNQYEEVKEERSY